jgi:hypothetical protein
MIGGSRLEEREAAGAVSEDLEPSGQVRSLRFRGRIRALETWLDDEPVSLAGCDLWVCHQRTRPLDTWEWLYFYSLHVDLSQTEAQLLAAMRKNTSREIRQAESRDGLTCSFNADPSEADLEAYAAIFDADRSIHSQHAMDRNWLMRLRKAGLVQLAQVRDSGGQVLAWHCLLCHRRSATVQLSSMVSLQHQADRTRGAAIGRANRWLFYREFLHYKQQGILIYDFNGWYSGIEDEKLLGINQFKEGFGGRIRYGYDCQQPLTLQGRVYLLLLAIRRRLFQPEEMKDWRRRRRKAPRLPDI